MNVEGLITVRSCFGFSETLARLETAVRANGMFVVMRVDYGRQPPDASRDATTLLLFEHRALQVELVKALRLIALELPFRMLIRQDPSGRTLLSYPDFRWLAVRYAAPRDDAYLFTDMAVTIDGIANKAGSPP